VKIDELLKDYLRVGIKGDSEIIDIAKAGLASTIRQIKQAIAEAIAMAIANVRADNGEQASGFLKRARELKKQYEALFQEWRRLVPEGEDPDPDENGRVADAELEEFRQNVMGSTKDD